MSSRIVIYLHQQIGSCQDQLGKVTLIADQPFLDCNYFMLDKKSSGHFIHLFLKVTETIKE